MKELEQASTKSSVQSLAKAFKVLEAVAGADFDMTLSEIAAAAVQIDGVDGTDSALERESG